MSRGRIFKTLKSEIYDLKIGLKAQNVGREKRHLKLSCKQNAKKT